MKPSWKKLRFNINDLLEELRLNGCHDISDVAVAVLETSGKLSVIPKDKARPVTVEDLQLENVRHDGLPCVIVSDGTLNEGELTRAQKRPHLAYKGVAKNVILKM